MSWLVKKPLGPRDKNAFLLHADYIKDHPDDPINPILHNFCKRVGIDEKAFVCQVLHTFEGVSTWMEYERAMRHRKLI